MYFNRDIEIMEKCFEIAKKTDCRRMGFGAIIVNEKYNIISKGVNHIADKSLEYLCNPECIRNKENIQSRTRLEVCATVHAEQAAIINAYKKGYNNLSNTILFVGGIFPDGRKYIKNEKSFTCSFCSRIIAEAGIPKIGVPVKANNELGYEVMFLNREEYLKSSFEFATGIKKSMIISKSCLFLNTINTNQVLQESNLLFYLFFSKHFLFPDIFFLKVF